MHAKVTGLQELSNEQEQELGHLWLMAMFYMNIKVEGVKVEFSYDN